MASRQFPIPSSTYIHLYPSYYLVLQRCDESGTSKGSVNMLRSLIQTHGSRLASRGHPARGQATRRCLHLAPPFLLDDYVPRYQMLSARDSAMKRSKAYAHLRNCNLCPRLCGVNRYERSGMCLIGEKAKVNVIAPHFGEGMLPCASLASQFFPSRSMA